MPSRSGPQPSWTESAVLLLKLHQVSVLFSLPLLPLPPSCSLELLSSTTFAPPFSPRPPLPTPSPKRQAGLALPDTHYSIILIPVAITPLVALFSTPAQLAFGQSRPSPPLSPTACWSGTNVISIPQPSTARHIQRRHGGRPVQGSKAGFQGQLDCQLQCRKG
jgi:hypothetical protein